MGHGKPKKKYYTENEPGQIAHTTSYLKPQQNTRRISVLNKLFMKYITDLLASEPRPELVGKGFTVTKVAISPDFHSLNVYWIPRVTNDCEDFDKLLSNLSYSIRHELSQLNLIGNVPNILFVRDSKYEKGCEILKLISEVGSQHQSEVESDDTLEAPDDNPSNIYETFYSENNIFGLERQAIFEKIVMAKQKSLADHRSGNVT